MMILNANEMAGIRRIETNVRKHKLWQRFHQEFLTKDSNKLALSAFFSDAFDNAITLPSIRDVEIINLCRLAYMKQECLSELSEFKRCKKEGKWPGRLLFINAAIERCGIVR